MWYFRNYWICTRNKKRITKKSACNIASGFLFAVRLGYRVRVQGLSLASVCRCWKFAPTLCRACYTSKTYLLWHWLHKNFVNSILQNQKNILWKLCPLRWKKSGLFQACYSSKIICFVNSGSQQFSEVNFINQNYFRIDLFIFCLQLEQAKEKKSFFVRVVTTNNYFIFWKNCKNGILRLYTGKNTVFLYIHQITIWCNYKTVKILTMVFDTSHNVSYTF